MLLRSQFEVATAAEMTMEGFEVQTKSVLIIFCP